MYGNARITYARDEEAVRLPVEPAAACPCRTSSSPTTRMIGGHDERHQREERDHGPQPRQLQVHPVDGRDEAAARPTTIVSSASTNESLSVVQNSRVVRRSRRRPRGVQHFPVVSLLEAEEQRREQRDQEVGSAEHQPERPPTARCRRAASLAPTWTRAAGAGCRRASSPRARRTSRTRAPAPMCGFESTSPLKLSPIWIGTRLTAPPVSPYAVA